MMERCPRSIPPLDGSEKETMLGFLTWQRETLLCKLDGLDDEQMRRPHQPSGMSLLGITKHLTDAERLWFREVFAGEDLSAQWDAADPDRYWRIEPEDTTAGIIEGYRQEIALANALVIPDTIDLSMRVRSPRSGEERMTLRWVIGHMIEETARHDGHADLIREAIDGQTGE